MDMKMFPQKSFTAQMAMLQSDMKRTDMPWTEDCPDPELVEMVRNYRTDKRPVLYSLFEKYPEKHIIIFRTRLQADNWLSGAES